MINVFCFCRFVIGCWRFLWLCVWMCIKGDGDGSSAVDDYVAQTELRQQPTHERRRWLFFELKNLVLAKVGSRLVDIARFHHYQLHIQRAQSWKRTKSCRSWTRSWESWLIAVQRHRVRRWVSKLHHVVLFFAFCMSCRCECWIWSSRWVDLNGGFASVLYVVGTAGLDMSVCEEFVSKLVADAAEQIADERCFWCGMQLAPLDLTVAHDDRPSLLDLCRYLELDAGGMDKDGVIVAGITSSWRHVLLASSDCQPGSESDWVEFQQLGALAVFWFEKKSELWVCVCFDMRVVDIWLLDLKYWKKVDSYRGEIDFWLVSFMLVAHSF